MKKLRLCILFIFVAFIVTGCSCSKQLKEYTVTFDTQGGNTIEYIKVEENNKVTKPDDPTREGYTFVGWYLDLDDEESYDFNSSVTKDITLYAKWASGSNVYTITLNIDGKLTTIETDENGLISKPTNPSKSGYTFVGWYLDDEKYDFKTPFTSDSTLVAKFTKSTATSTTKYTVTFDSNGGSKVASKTVTSGKTVSEPTKPTKDGYTFVEWQLNGNKYNFSTKVTKNITLKAVWSKNNIAVKSVSLNVSSLTLNVNDTNTLVATIKPSDATNKNVTWKSSDSSIVKVDSNGQVTALSAGTATITVTTKDGSKTASVTITVVDSYTATFTAVYTGSKISGYTYKVYKNNTEITNYSLLTCGKYSVTPKSGQMDTLATATNCTLKLAGNTYNVTATYEK